VIKFKDQKPTINKDIYIYLGKTKTNGRYMGNDTIAVFESSSPILLSLSKGFSDSERAIMTWEYKEK
jgi:hypothetical protein